MSELKQLAAFIERKLSSGHAMDAATDILMQSLKRVLHLYELDKRERAEEGKPPRHSLKIVTTPTGPVNHCLRHYSTMPLQWGYCLHCQLEDIEDICALER